MDNFKQQLQRYLKRECALSDVEAALAKLIQEAPQHADAVYKGLQGLAEKGGISADDAERLYAVIEHARSVIVQPDATENIQAPEVDDDRTRVAESAVATEPQDADDDRTVVQMPVDNRAGSDKGAEDDDRTQFNPGAATGQTAVDSAPDGDDDRTRVNIPPKQDETGSVTGTNTQTTSTTSTTGWNKPFVDDEDAVVSVGSVLKDRFRLVEFIGAGGMGDVYIAEDSLSIEADDVETQVAVKVLNKEFRDHPESFRAMQREARKTMDLAHPNIVNVFTFDRDQSNAFMVMELMRGLPMDKAIKQQPYGFPLEQVESYVGGMGEALKYAHQRGVIHCDFKPSNIFIDDEIIKVFDFGIARAASNGPKNQKQDNFDAGDLGAFTPSYASIELIENADEVDPRDDIYALGCITYELLTGRHPFIKDGKKVPANKALELGLKPERIKKLNRKQWQALQSALAFPQKDRVPSVEEFLTAFLQQEQNTGLFNRWYMWPVVGLVLAGAAYFPVRDWMERKAIDDFADSLDGLDRDQVKNKLQVLDGMDEDLQEQYFSHRKVENTLMTYFQQSIRENARADEFQEAERLAKRAIEIYKNSAAFTNAIEIAKESVEKEKKERLNSLNDELSAFLELAPPLFAEQLPVIEDWRETVAKVEPNHSMIRDPRLALKFVEVVEALSGKGLFEPAQQLLASAQTMYPQQTELAALVDRIASQQRKQALASQLGEVEGRVEELLSQKPDLELLASYENDVRALRDIAPDNPLLIKLDKLASGLIAEQLPSLFDTYQWADANDLIAQYSWIMSSTQQQTLATSVEDAFGKYQNALDEAIASLDAAVAKGRLSGKQSAETYYVRLQKLNPDMAVLDDARASIAQGWLKQVRQARVNQQWDKAQNLIANGKAAVGEEWALTFEEEQQRLSEAQDTASQQLLAEQKQEQQRQLQLELSDLSDRFAAILDADSPTLSSSREALAILDQIEVLDATHPMVSDGRTQLVDSYLINVETQLQNVQLDAAMALAGEGQRLFPDEQRFSQLQDEVGLAMEQQKQQAQAELLANLRAQTKQLVAQGLVDEGGSAAFDQLIDEMSSSGAASSEIRALRTQAAIRFVGYAEQLTAENRFDVANEALTLAQRYDGELGTIDSQIAATEAAELAFNEQQVNNRLAARVDGLKQSFRTQIGANDISKAIATYDELKGLLPQDDIFVQQEGRDAIVAAYLKVTEQLAKRHSYTRAIKLLQGARPYATDIAIIDDKQGEYERDRSLYLVGVAVNEMTLERFTQAEKLMRELKEQIPEDRYSTLEERLQEAVLGKVNALAESDFEVATALLQKAKLFYPDSQDIQGTELSPPVKVAEPAPVAEKVAKKDIAGDIAAQLQQAGNSISKLLGVKGTLDSSRSQMSGAAFAELDQAIVGQLSPLLKKGARLRDDAVKPQLKQAQALWPNTQAIQSIKWPGSVATAGRECTPNLAGYGTRRKAVCFDMLGQDQKAPFMIVSPKLNGSHFAISKFEISIGDYNRYCTLSGNCSAIDGNPKVPLASVSVAQIKSYTAWLSERTGQRYRLPTIDEWKHVATANGKRQPKNYNCRLESKGSILKGKSLQEVFAGKGNGWGFVNYLGNVQEVALDGGSYVAVGGYYKDQMSKCSISLSRPANTQGDRDTGFRLVREM